MFVPRNFRGLARFYESEGSERVNLRDIGVGAFFTLDYLVGEILPELYKRHGICHSNVVCKSMKLVPLHHLDAMSPMMT